MQLRRQGASSLSPLREIYGKANGKLLLPLDLCLMVDIGGVETAQFPSPAGVLNGDSIIDSGGGVVGSIFQYDWPPNDIFAVSPFVQVTANGDISQVPDGHAAMPSVNLQDIVELQVIGNDLSLTDTGVRGRIVELDALRAWPDLSRRVRTYLVEFSQQLHGPTHGGRVILQHSRDLLGMLLFTENQPSGKCNAFVYPSHLI